MNKPDSSPDFNCFFGDKREELTELLRSRLIECGWRDQVANMCRNLIQKHGVEQVRLEQLIAEVRPVARQSVPEHVKTELLEMLKKLDSSTQLVPQSEEPSPPPTRQRQQQQQQQQQQQKLPAEQTAPNNNSLL